LATACFWPSILAEAEVNLKVNTTFLFILLGSVGVIGFAFTPWIMGVVGDAAELRFGFAIIPLLFIGLIIVLLIERRLSKKASKTREELKRSGQVA
jgi:fucose permease